MHYNNITIFKEYKELTNNNDIMLNISNLEISRYDYDNILINLFDKIKNSIDNNKIKIKILMHNEVTREVLVNVSKLFSNMVQNMEKYDITRDFYYFIELDNIKKLILFLKQDLETDDWLIETPTPLCGDTPFQNHNFWKKIIINFPKGSMIFKRNGIRLEIEKDTKGITKLIYDEFINYKLNK